MVELTDLVKENLRSGNSYFSLFNTGKLCANLGDKFSDGNICGESVQGFDGSYWEIIWTVLYIILVGYVSNIHIYKEIPHKMVPDGLQNAA